MPTVSCVCPRCDQTFREEFSPNCLVVRCPHCGRTFDGTDDGTDAIRHAGQRGGAADAAEVAQISQCLICDSPELFVRKDFPQRLGVTIVCIGFLASSIAWYYYSIWATFGILFGTALIDLLLFLSMGNVLECYRCHSQFRDVDGLEDYAPFDLEVHERHRQLAARKKTLNESSLVNQSARASSIEESSAS